MQIVPETLSEKLKRADGGAQVVEHLSSNPGTTRGRERERERTR
jgi:hypothetical protein